MWTALCSFTTRIKGMLAPGVLRPSRTPLFPLPGTPVTYRTPYARNAFAMTWPPVNFTRHSRYFDARKAMTHSHYALAHQYSRSKNSIQFRTGPIRDALRRTERITRIRRTLQPQRCLLRRTPATLAD